MRFSLDFLKKVLYNILANLNYIGDKAMKNPELVIMAAGMGSRYGGLKQIDKVDEEGHIIIDYSIYDAIRAGFRDVTFIIKKEIEKDFREVMDKHLEGKDINVKYVYQELYKLPEGYSIPEGRRKPWGTAHALMCCLDTVEGPFAVINADDYYGANAFYEIQEHLASAGKGEFAMTAFHLGNTLSKNGTVSRGICETENGYLRKVTEFTKINSDGSYEKDGYRYTFTKDVPVSMNLWGLTPDIFDILDEEFAAFLENADLMKDEFFIPSVISKALETGKATVKVFKNADKWYGITYREDLAEVKEAIGGYVEDGLYEGI